MIVLWFVGIFLLCCCHGEENVYQVESQKALNVVNEDFIGYATDVKCLKDQKCLEGLREISLESKDKIYVKLHGLDDPPSYDSLSAIKDLTESTKIVPIIVLNYKPSEWQPRQHLKLLQNLNRLQVNNCVFQLGADLFVEDLFTYTDDLSTLRFMIDAFEKFNNTWMITGGDLSETLCLADARIYTKLAKNFVASFTWKQRLNSSAEVLSPSIEHIVDESFLPVSVTYRRQSVRSKDPRKCDHQCVTEGLRWAEELGEISKRGFFNVFRTVGRKDFISKNFADYVDEIYQKMMGSIVLKVKPTSDHLTEKIHAQCSRENPGGIVLMGVNPSEKSIKITTKFPGVMLGRRLANMIKEVILRSENDHIYLNNHLLDGTAITTLPVDLEKLTHDEILTVTVPPKSVGFWEIPGANVTICRELEDITDEPVLKKPADSSMSKLLQELIQEISVPSRKSREGRKRTRRSLRPLFPKKREVSEKLKQFFGLFNKKIRGIPPFQVMGQINPQFSAPTDYESQMYSAYQNPMMYSGGQQGHENVYENPMLYNQDIFAQLLGEQDVVPPMKQQKKMQLKKYQAQQKPALGARASFAQSQGHASQQAQYASQSGYPTLYSGQPSISIMPATAEDIADQGAPFMGQVVPGQTYHLSDAEAATYLAGYGGQQDQQQPIEYSVSPQAQIYGNAQTYGNAQPIYLNSYPADEVNDAQVVYKDISSLGQIQGSQGFAFPSAGLQNNQMAYSFEGYPGLWDQKETSKDTPKLQQSPNPAQKPVTSFVAGTYPKNQPEAQVQQTKSDQNKNTVNVNQKPANMNEGQAFNPNSLPMFNLNEAPNNDGHNEGHNEMAILAQLGLLDIMNIDENDQAQDVIKLRRRRSIFSEMEGRKLNLLDMDLFPLSDDADDSANDIKLGHLKSHLDDMFNFLPRSMHKNTPEPNPHLETLQTETKDMKKQCKILSVAMENECLHDTIDDIRSLAKRAVKYIGRRKFLQMMDMVLPRKLKKRRFMRSPKTTPWSKEEVHLPLVLNDLKDALRTNKIFPVNPDEQDVNIKEFVHSEPTSSTHAGPDPIAAVAIEEEKTVPEESVAEIHQSLHDFVNAMGSQIMNWWNLFA